MSNISTFRKSLIVAGMMAACAAVPFSQAMAQDSMSPSQATPTSQASDNQTVPGKVDDAWITTKVKSELAAAKNIKSTDISVTTNDGVVTLTGTVTGAKQKTHAEHVAKKVKGVKSVDASGLTVSAASSTSGSGS